MLWGHQIRSNSETSTKVFVQIFTIRESVPSWGPGPAWSQHHPVKDHSGCSFRDGSFQSSSYCMTIASFCFDSVHSHRQAIWEWRYEGFPLEQEGPRATSKEQLNQKFLNVRMLVILINCFNVCFPLGDKRPVVDCCWLGISGVYNINLGARVVQGICSPQMMGLTLGVLAAATYFKFSWRMHWLDRFSL